MKQLKTIIAIGIFSLSLLGAEVASAQNAKRRDNNTVTSISKEERKAKKLQRKCAKKTRKLAQKQARHDRACAVEALAAHPERAEKCSKIADRLAKAKSKLESKGCIATEAPSPAAV